MNPMVKLGPSQFLALEPTVAASNFKKFKKKTI
jgi:hypothetical protein